MMEMTKGSVINIVLRSKVGAAVGDSQLPVP